MGDNREKHLLRGMVAGIGAGLAASWVMNVFIAGPGEQLRQSLQTEEEKRQEQEQQRKQKESGEPKQDATMKTADAIVAAATGGEHLSMEARQKGGPVVHYAFGALVGGLYGGLAEYSGAVRSGFGTAYGAAVFAGADLVAVPALHLSAPLSEFPPRTLATPFAAHLVYGVTTELVRRVLRALL